MATTVYVLHFSPADQAWIRTALESSVGSVLVLTDTANLRADPCPDQSCCLLVSADADAAETLKLVRELRQNGIMIPVIVLGSHSAFRVAVDIARLEATDFLERPISSRQLRQAVVGSLKPAPR